MLGGLKLMLDDAAPDLLPYLLPYLRSQPEALVMFFVSRLIFKVAGEGFEPPTLGL
jgi:hypothetical protein